MRIADLVVCSFLLAACSDDAKVASDADATSPDSAGDAAVDASPDSASDSETPDTIADSAAPDTTADSAVPDTADATADSAVPDAADATADSALPDAAADSALPDAPDAAACEYFEEPELITCGQANVQILHWKDFGAAGCAPYYTRGADRYDTVEALAAAEGCSADCVYIARQAVDFIRCDGQGRSGWETYEADGEGCLAALYSTADGIFTDLCFWAQYACYCEQ